jgi:polysaccharide biosynthesis/export protein
MSRIVRVSRFAGLVLAVAGAFGLSSTLAWAQTPKPGVASLQAAQATPQAATPAGQVDRTDYILGPADQIQVFVWRNPDLSATVPVRPDGRISTPLVEDMVAVGKTPSQLARDIEKVLGEYVRTPQVNVIVTQPSSTFSQVKVVGQVLHPQVMPYRNGLTVLDAILASGGLGQFAAGNRSKLVRTIDGKQIEIKLKLANLLNDGDMKQNVPLQPGDVLIIPESRF